MTNSKLFIKNLYATGRVNHVEVARNINFIQQCQAFSTHSRYTDICHTLKTLNLPIITHREIKSRHKSAVWLWPRHNEAC